MAFVLKNDGSSQEQLRKIMEEEMSSVVEKVVEKTPPVSTGGLESGTKTVQAEINKVFQPIRSEWFCDVVAQGQWEPVSAYKFVFRSKRLEDAFNRRQLDVLDRAFNNAKARDSNVVINWAGKNPSPEIHKQERGRDGRIVPNNVVWYTADKTDIKRYAQKVAKNIGSMVAGWYTVLNKLGKSVKSPFPGKGAGSVSYESGNGKTVLVVENEQGNFNEMLSRSVNPQGLINQAAVNCERRWSALRQGQPDPKKGRMGAPSPKMPAPQPATNQQMKQLAEAPYISPQEAAGLQELLKQTQISLYRYNMLLKLLKLKLS